VRAPETTGDKRRQQGAGHNQTNVGEDRVHSRAACLGPLNVRLRLSDSACVRRRSIKARKRSKPGFAWFEYPVGDFHSNGLRISGGGEWALKPKKAPLLKRDGGARDVPIKWSRQGRTTRLVAGTRNKRDRTFRFRSLPS
jgi:hypothetical protein